MNWVELLLNPVVIRSIYGDRIPSLSGVEIHEFRLRRDGSDVEVRFDLSEFPEDPPEKWKTWVNTIQVELAIVGVESLSIREWQTTMIADLSIDSIGDDLLRFRSNPVPDCTILARWIRVAKISAYHDSRRSATPLEGG